MDNLALTLWRIAILTFTAFLVWVFHKPEYLGFMLMLVFTRKKRIRKDIAQELDDLHYKLDTVLSIKKDANNTP